MQFLPSKTAVFDPQDGLPPYRMGVLLVLVRAGGLVLTGARTEVPLDGKPWQFPQGGIKAFMQPDGTTALEAIEQAALRELREELGAAVQAEIGAIGAAPLCYEFDRPGHQKYRGQRLTPVLLRYLGGVIDVSQIEDGDDKPAFSAFRWDTVKDVLAEVTINKRELYQRVLADFSVHIEALHE